MKRITFALISDSLFCALCAFIASFVTLGYFISLLPVAFAGSLMISVAALIISFAVMYSKRRKKLTVYADAAEKRALAMHLSVSGERYVAQLLSSALEAKDMGNRLENEESAYFCRFTLSPLSPDDVARCIKRRTEKKKIILCCAAGEESCALAADFGIKIMTIGEVYELLKSKNLLPEKYACGEPQKPNILKKIAKRFNRRISPSLFFCGVGLLAFSLFTFYRIYYVVFGGALMMLAAVSVLFGGEKA